MIRHLFGLQVIKEDTPNTYKVPTNALCLQTDSDRGDVTIQTEDCNPLSNYKASSHKIVIDGENPEMTIPVKQPLPLSLGGIEDLLLCAGLKKTTATTPDRNIFELDSNSNNTLSTLLTTLRTSSKGKGGRVTFSISGSISKRIEIEATINTARDGYPTELASGDPDNTIPTLNLSGATDVFWYKRDNPILINGVAVRAKSFKFDIGAEIQTNENDTDGKNKILTLYNPTLEIVADNAVDLAFKASDAGKATEFNFVIPMSDNLGVKKGNILASKGTMQSEPKISNNNGLEEVTTTYDLLMTNGDDNFSIEIYT